ncbi:MAG: hypothetical protein NTV78_01585 [Caldiserica bacterium]|nr:hypothetical protein [Caldisericota bacterium]
MTRRSSRCRNRNERRSPNVKTAQIPKARKIPIANQHRISIQLPLGNQPVVGRPGGT